MPFPLPKDTNEIAQSGRRECRNWGLLFQRFVEFENGWALEGKNKLTVLKDLTLQATEARRSTDQRSRDYRHLVEQQYQRWRQTVKAAGAPDDCIFEASPEWRLVIGLGGESVLETGFTFHHVYGFPYIPGSALKGLTQTYALWQVAEHFGVPGLVSGQKANGDTPVQKLEALLLTADDSNRRDLIEKLQHDSLIPVEARMKTLSIDELETELATHEAACDYRAVFGTQETQGKAVFFDAVPVEAPRLAVDVMNPHYGEYYQGQGATPPANYLSPVPVYFLTVERGSRFAFAVAGDDVDQVRLACKWLKEALGTLGAGGKTSAGYGYFQLVTAPAAVRTESRDSSVTAIQDVAPAEAPASETWFDGKVREYNPGRGKGRLIDDQSGEELHFRRDAIQDKGWSPGKGHKVRYVISVQGGRKTVIKLIRN